MKWSVTGKIFLKIVNSSPDRVIFSFRCKTWPRQLICSVLVKVIFISLSGVIQVKNTKFGDRYVSVFANLSLLLICQPIKKTFVFYRGQ